MIVPDPLGLWRRFRDELNEKIRTADDYHAEIIRFQLQILDWLINDTEGHNSQPRTEEEIKSECVRIEKEKINAVSRERFRLEVQYAYLMRTLRTMSRGSVFTDAKDERSRDDFGSPLWEGRVASANFQNYSEMEKKEFLERARKDEVFAKGFMDNSSAPLQDETETKKLSLEDRKSIFDLALISPKNMRAFGASRGREFSYLSNEDRNGTIEMLRGKRANGSDHFEIIPSGELLIEFRRGFGEGLAAHFPELISGDLTEIRGLIEDDPEFVEGLRNNLRWFYDEVSEKEKSNLFGSPMIWDPKFGRMLGIAYGMGFARITQQEGEVFLELAQKSDYAAEGIGYGYGLVCDKLSESENELLQSLLGHNVSFLKGLKQARS